MSGASRVDIYQAAWVLTLGEQGSIPDGAVAVQGTTILDVGPAKAILDAHPEARRFDLGGDAWLMPGLRNGHGHFGEWPADQPLELFLMDRYGPPSSPEGVRALARRTAASLLRSGVTWTHHLHYGPYAESAIDGYLDVGIRLQFCLGALDRYSVLPYDYGDTELLSMLSAEERQSLAGQALGKTPVDWDHWSATFVALQERYAGHPGVQIIAGPDNPQWCSDDLLGRLGALGVPLHLHVQENAAQRIRAIAIESRSPVARLARLGLLRADVTLAHVTHADDADLELIAGSGAAVVVNASSNLRLGSGLPSMARLLAHGIAVGIGMDGGGFADDLDMLAEIRLNALLARVDPAMPAIDSSTVLRSSAGRLLPGHSADFVALRVPLGGEADPERAVVAQATHHHVGEVWIGGNLVLSGGQVVGVPDAELQRPTRRQAGSHAAQVLGPYVRATLRSG